jgi:hypothetical protein
VKPAPRLWLTFLLAVACGHQGPPPTTLRATPTNKAAAPASGCTTDADCDTGFRCAIGRSGTGGSVCMKEDEDAFRSAVDLPVATCTFSSDCPVGFHCDRDGNVCVK